MQAKSPLKTNYFGLCEMKNTLLLLTFGSLVIALGACSGAKEQLGIAKKAPDEFAVVKRAPLAMPPDYSLRPPRPGAPRPQEMATDDQAREAIFGEGQAPVQGGSGPETVLLQKAGAGYADPDIRQRVDAETETMHDRNKPVAEKLFGIGGDPEEASATVVNAAEESERIQKNIEEGKSVTEGETPVIEE